MAIGLRSVRFAYPEAPERTVLNIPSWSIAAGEHAFVHGSSGSGKSTLLNLLSGMLRTPVGEVSVMGHRLDQMGDRQRDQFRANHVGYVFQQFNLIPYLHAVDNIQLASYFSKGERAGSVRDEIAALLSRLNIPEEEWLKPTASLSIGQQQRVAIARALINKPELLIADEPTSSLDQENRDNFMSVLMSLAEADNTTLICVSHDMSLSRHFNRIDSMDEISAGGAGD